MSGVKEMIENLDSGERFVLGVIHGAKVVPFRQVSGETLDDLLDKRLVCVINGYVCLSNSAAEVIASIGGTSWSN